MGLGVLFVCCGGTIGNAIECKSEWGLIARAVDN